MSPRLRGCWHGVVRCWQSLQIDLRGEYSVDHLCVFRDFCAGTSVKRAMTIVTVMPLPCLLIVIGPDLLPLEAPERGFVHSHLFWVRTFISCWFLQSAVLIQCQHFVTTLPVTLSQILRVAIVSLLCTVSFAIGLAYGIGFPVPFMVNMVAPSGALAFVLQLWTQLRQTPLSHAELQQFGYITNIQLGFGLAYPAYTTAFYKLSGVPQTLFALLLPVMKLAAKNWINIAIPHREDAKAEFANLNAEVYHAMFFV